jgi:hypothetical protein
MKHYTLPLAAVLSLTLGGASESSAGEKAVQPAPNGIEFPSDYHNWRVISISHRTDHKSMRTILGNDVAVEAARAGKTNPWPDGAVLGKVVWKQTTEKHWPTAIAPMEFVHVEFMAKDSQKWASTGGWGYSRWVGNELEPYGKSAGFVQECVACHTLVKGEDWVFTTPADMPVMPH